MSNGSQSIKSHLFTYSTSVIVVQFINFILAIFIRNSLGPEKMGVWVVVQIFLSYSKFTSLGMGKAASREFPYYQGKGESSKAFAIRNTALCYIVGSSLFLGALITIFAFSFRERVSSIVFYSSLTIAVASILTRISNFMISMLRAEKKFDFASEFNIYSAIVNAILTVILILSFGLYGYYVAMVLSILFNLTYLSWSSKLDLKLRFDINLFKGLSKFGIPLSFMGFILNFFLEADRISISTFMDMNSLGLYSLVTMAGNIIFIFPNLLGIVIWPYLTEAYGREASKADLKKFIQEPAFFIALYIPVLIALIWAIAPYFVHMWMPKYIDGIAAMKCGMFIVAIRVMVSMLNQALITFKLHLKIIPVLCVAIVLVYGLNFLIARAGLGLVGVSLSTLFFTATFYLYLLRICSHNSSSQIDFRSLSFSVIGFFLYTAGFLLGMDRILNRHDLVITLILRILFIIPFLLPLLAYGERKFKTLSHVIQHFHNRLAK